MQFVWGNLIELIIYLNPQGPVHAFSAFVPFTQSPSIAFSLVFCRRCAVQNLERRELLAGDFTFSSPFQFPYQIIEDGSLFGSIDIETALPRVLKILKFNCVWSKAVDSLTSIPSVKRSFTSPLVKSSTCFLLLVWWITWLMETSSSA